MHPQSSEFCIGAQALADFWRELTGEEITEKAARERVYAGLIPARRLGGRILASKAAIREHLDAHARGRVEPEPEPVEPDSDVVTRDCRACGQPFTYEQGKPGRPPTRCDACRHPEPPPPAQHDRLEPDAEPPPPEAQVDRLPPAVLAERIAALLARTGMMQKQFVAHAASKGPRKIDKPQLSTFLRGLKTHGDAVRDQMQAALEELERRP